MPRCQDCVLQGRAVATKDGISSHETTDEFNASEWPRMLGIAYSYIPYRLISPHYAITGLTVLLPLCSLTMCYLSIVRDRGREGNPESMEP